MEEQQDPKELYEQKKAQRERQKQEKQHEQKKQETKRNVHKKSTVYIMWAVLIALVAYGLFVWVQKAGPQGEDFSTSYEIQGRQHIVEGADHPAYNSNPPSSGWHYTQPAQGGFYEEPLPDERVIHNLEHGDIWIAYHPDISEEEKNILEGFAGQYVVVSPRSNNDGDISLVAWGRVDTFDIENKTVNEQRINDFIKRYDNRGPEKVR